MSATGQASSGSKLDGTMYAGESVPVKFFTTSFEVKMPATTYYMPVKVTMESLSEFVNLTLGLATKVPFNFLVKNEFIRHPTLEKWMKKMGTNKETTIELEYTPAFEIEAGNNLPHDDWVSAIRRLPILTDKSADPSQHPYLTVSYDKCWRIWKGEDCLHVGAGHGSAIKCASIVSASEAEVDTGKRKRDAIQCKFVTGGKDGNVFLWQYSGGMAKELYKFEHPESVDTVSVHPDKSLICTGGWDRLVRVWTLDRLEDDINEGLPGKQQYLHCSMVGHARAVFAAEWSREKRARLFSTGFDGTLRVWDVIKQAPVMNLRSECFAAYSLAVHGSSSNDKILTGHTDNRIRLWDTRTPSVCQTYSAHKGFVYSVLWNAFPNDRATHQFTSGSEDCNIHLWDIRSQIPLATSSEHTDGILCQEWMGNGVVMTGSKDHTVKSCTITSHKKTGDVKMSE